MEEVFYIVEIETLPEKCSCGSQEGSTKRVGIATSDGNLLKEVTCNGCGKSFLIPDEVGRWEKELLKEKFRPTWYYDPEINKIVHWSAKSG